MEGLSELLWFQWASDGGPVSIEEAALRLVLAILLSATVGIDRELKHKPLGLRTNMLVALGAASFSLMALQLVHELAGGPPTIRIDPSRVMEAIVAITDRREAAGSTLPIGGVAGRRRREGFGMDATLVARGSGAGHPWGSPLS
jgi:hypothetical protein